MMRGGLKAIWRTYEVELIILGLLLVAWKLRGLFSAVGDIGGAVGDVVAGATANVQQGAKEASQKAAVKAVNHTATASDLATFERDAETLAQATGGKSWWMANGLNTSWRSAYDVARRYSRVVTRTYGGKIIVVGDRKKELTLPVLTSFYKDATNGRSLAADLDEVMKFAPKPNQDFYAKYIK